MTKALPAKAHFETATEGLRGIAALLVIYTHLLTPTPVADPGYAVSPLFWRYEASQGAVLLFFVLSGYVIGITNKKPFTGGNAREYAARRGIRILPLYIAAVILTVLVGGSDLWRDVLGNLCFLQNDISVFGFHFEKLKGNHSLWTLNYEVLYYALFLFVWRTPRAWWGWLVFAAIAGAAALLLPAVGELLATYAAAWVFWLAGYGLSRSPAPAEGHSVDPLPWPSLAIIWWVTWRAKPLWALGHRFALLPEHGDAWMNFSYYDFVLPCISLLIATSGRRPPGYRTLLRITLLWPLGFLAWRASREHFSAQAFSAETILVVAAAALWWWRPSTKVLTAMAPIGAISYGIYIFHAPVLWFVAHDLGLPAGSVGTFALRCGLVLALTFLVSWLGESRLQPWIRDKLYSRKPR